MITTSTKYHYKDLDGTMRTVQAVTHHFSSGSEEINSYGVRR